MKYLSLILGVIFAVGVQAIYIQVGSRNTCYLIKLQPEESCKVTFEVSGQDEDDFVAQLKDEHTQKIEHSFYNKREGIMEMPAKNEGQSLQLCFRAPDGIPKFLTFEVYKNHEEKSSNYLSQDNILKTERHFKEAEEALMELYTKFRHMSIREKTHINLMKSTEQKINYCSITKMIVVLLVFTVQIVMITNQFKDKEQKFQMI